MARKRKIVYSIFILLSIAAAVSKLFIGFDIDEGYAIAMPYRMLMGDRLFSEMWEIHQTSSFLPALLMWLYLKLTGSTEGIVLYLRIVSTIIHLAMTCGVFVLTGRIFNTARYADESQNAKNTRNTGNTESTGNPENICDYIKAAAIWDAQMIAALVYFNLLPKWMQSLDFSMQQLWGVTLVIFCLYLEKDKKRDGLAFLTGTALSLTVLGYVGMIVLYPVMIGIYIFDKKAGRSMIRIIYMTAGCAVMALAFFIYCIPVQGVPVNEFVSNIPNIFMDGTHTLGMADKLSLYASQWAVVVKHSAIFIVAAVIMVSVEKVIFKNRKDEGILISLTEWVIIISSSLLVFGPIISIKMGPFHFQSRFLLIYILMWAIAIRFCRGNRKTVSGNKSAGYKAGNRTGSNKNVIVEKNESMPRYMFWCTMWISLFSFAGILLFSNVGPDSSSSYLVPGLVAGLVMMLSIHAGIDNIGFRGYRIKGRSYLGENGYKNDIKNMSTDSDSDSTDRNDSNKAGSIRQSLKKNYPKIRFCIAAGLFILSLAMCKGFYVRYTEYYPADITQKREQVQGGPMDGLCLLPEDISEEKAARSAIGGAATYGSAMLLGTDQILDLSMNGRIICPSTISTPAFNSQWVLYFDKYPELLPDVVFVAKNTIDNREKFFAQNEFGQYLAERYDIAGMKENDALCWVMRLK